MMPLFANLQSQKLFTKLIHNLLRNVLKLLVVQLFSLLASSIAWNSQIVGTINGSLDD